MTYEIVRYHFKGEAVIVKRGLTLEEAQEHCSDPETSSKTCTDPMKVEYTAKHGMWFEGYREE